MTDIPYIKPLELNVTNFGPIAEGKIELRPFTVFVGPSNTGKTYFAQMIYTLQGFFSSLFGKVDRFPTLPSELRAESTRDSQEETGELSDSLVSGLVSWFTESSAHHGAIGKVPGQSRLELPKEIATQVRPFLGDVTAFGEDLDKEFARCFGVDETRHLRNIFCRGNTEICLERALPTLQGKSHTLSYEVKFHDQGTALSSSIPSSANLHVERSIYEEHLKPHFLANAAWTKEGGTRIFGHFRLLDLFARACTADIVAPLNLPSYYLPADRAGVMHLHHVIVRSLIASATRTGLRPDSLSPQLTGVHWDLLDQLVAMSTVSKRAHEEFGSIALRLENTLLQGEVSVGGSKQISYPSFSYRPLRWERDLPLVNSSSMVTELAPVVLYLRHVIQPGDLLIVEEPEAHLHPELQAKFIRLLVAAVQSGVRILITTHSEWILEELANLVRLSELPTDQREGIEDPEISLRPDQLGAWFFEPSEEAGGSVVREISLDEESATFPAGFGLVTENLYNRWVEISTRIQEN